MPRRYASSSALLLVSAVLVACSSDDGAATAGSTSVGGSGGSGNAGGGAAAGGQAGGHSGAGGHAGGGAGTTGHAGGAGVGGMAGLGGTTGVGGSAGATSHGGASGSAGSNAVGGAAGKGGGAAGASGGVGGTSPSGGNGGSPDPQGGAGGVSSSVWGTFDKPFAASSLWNSRPVSPVLGAEGIPPTENPSWFPVVGGGDFSTEAFLASDGDPAVTVHGPNGAAQAYCADYDGPCDVTIPHFPASVTPAKGSDGHADIVDVSAGIIHSFWQLKSVGGVWQTTQYSWAPLAGSGWGTPGHPSQGARASGVCTIAGVMRKSEAADGEDMFHHALAMSVDGSAEIPGFVFPATLEDGDSKTAYTGKIPMGSLMMLPATFDTSNIESPGLKKVIKTLQVYGARIVDTNTDTPFVLYVETGSTFTVSTLPPGMWDTTVENQLFDIAHALRPMVSSSGFLDGDGKPFTPDENLERMSMRGPWSIAPGAPAGVFDSWGQALVFPPTTTAVTQTNASPNWNYRVSWAPWTPGATFVMAVTATGGATLGLRFLDAMGTTLYETGPLGDGASKSFPMPGAGAKPVLIATSGVGAGSTVRGSLLAK